MVAARTTICRIATLAALTVCASAAQGQSGLLGPLKPSWLHHAGQLRRYICSERFRGLVGAGRDRDAVDSIFANAMMIADNDVADALLAATVACFDHTTIHVRLGLFTLPVPLSIDTDSIDACTRANLPSRLFQDTPREGDRDKLQHFFGSAYIQWISNSTAATGLFGKGIEWLEPALIVGGSDDERDIRADKLGQAFAILISNYYYVAPSVILDMAR